MIKRKPKIKVITQREMDKRFAVASNEHPSGVTRGSRIYITRKTNPLVIEHEKAHQQLGHRPHKMTIYQNADMEIKAQKIAYNKLGKPFNPRYLDKLYDSLLVNYWSTFSAEDKKRGTYINDLIIENINKAAKNNHIPYMYKRK